MEPDPARTWLRRSAAPFVWLWLVALLAGGGVGAIQVTANDVVRPASLATGEPTPPSVTVGAAAAPGAEPPPPIPAVTTTPPPPPTTTPPRRRSVVEQAHVPYAIVGDLVLVHPARLVERVAFHQSNHEGALAQQPTSSAVNGTVLESRDRLTAATSAADIVVDPATPIVSPVSGTVKRAGSYVLYCKHRDDYVVIEPDGRPGIEVKLLHITGEQVEPGQRVEAGVTLLAPRATILPFDSQVDDLRTADPAWPHVHVEVVDSSVPNVPSPGGGGGC